MAEVFYILKMLGGFCGGLLNLIYFGLRVTKYFTVVIMEIIHKYFVYSF